MGEADVEAGALVVELLSGRLWTDHAPTMHAEVLSALASNGFEAHAERAARYGARNGRIDIVAEYGGGGWVAIELDCRRPRRKSVEKLKSFPGYRIIGIRGIEQFPAVRGIHAIVTMRVAYASPSVKADRRIYRPAPVWATDWRGA